MRTYNNQSFSRRLRDWSKLTPSYTKSSFITSRLSYFLSRVGEWSYCKWILYNRCGCVNARPPLRRVQLKLFSFLRYKLLVCRVARPSPVLGAHCRLLHRSRWLSSSDWSKFIPGQRLSLHGDALWHLYNTAGFELDSLSIERLNRTVRYTWVPSWWN